MRCSSSQTETMMKKFLAVTGLWLAACALPPVETSASVPKVDARVAIAMSPDERSQRSQVYYYQKGYWFEEGRVVHNAAIKAFDAQFTDALPRENTSDFDVVVEVEGNGLLNPYQSTYYATAIARAYLPGGELIGQYEASASSYASLGNYEYESTYQKIYDEAFAKVARKFAASDELAKLVKSKNQT